MSAWRRIFSRAILPFYGGRKFSCPVCCGRFRKMKPFRARYSIKGVLVDNYTPDAICPRCSSGIRHRLGMAFLEGPAGLLKGKIKLLHFASEEGMGRVLRRKENIEYVACDIRPSRDAVCVDITDIPFADNTFDAVICNHVLEHVRDDRQAIAELFRVLKPSGWALITVPVSGDATYEVPGLDEKAREKAYGIAGHFRMNGLDFTAKLKEAGFSVRTYTLDDIPGDYVDRSVRTPHVESDKYLFFCNKQI